MDWGWKAPFRYPSVDRGPAQRTDAHHIPQAVEGGRGLGEIWLGQRLMEEHGGFLSNNVESMHPSSAQANQIERSPECPIHVNGRTAGLLTAIYPPGMPEGRGFAMPWCRLTEKLRSTYRSRRVKGTRPASSMAMQRSTNSAGIAIAPRCCARVTPT